MAERKPQRPLPAGVISSGSRWDGEDRESQVRARAPKQSEPRAEPSDPSTATERATPEDRARSLVDELIEQGPESLAPLVRRLLPLGNFALEELASAFPGPLWRPSLATDSRLPRPEELSASAAALTAFGEEAIPYVSRLMRSAKTEARYYATVVCAAYADPRLVGPLARVALDQDRECRRIALHLLSSYEHEPTYRAALAEMRKHASDVAMPIATRRRAISALTQLRDEAAAALFVDLLADSDRGIGTASRIGLRVLTAHDFGFSRESWLRWLSELGHESRIQWLIEGLGDGRTNIRLLASRELWRLTRFLQPLSETAKREAFVEAQQHYQQWWAKRSPPG